MLTKPRPTGQRLPLSAVIHPGDMEISAALGQRIIDEARFDGQRNIDRIYVLKHLENISRGQWFRSAIAFCIVDGKLYLVNGWHRIFALVESKKTLPFSIVLHECEDLYDVASIYARYDSVQRARTSAHIVDAYKLDARLGVSSVVAKAVYGVTPLLLNDLRPIYHNDPTSLTAKVQIGINDIRLGLALKYESEARAYEAILSKVKGRWKKLLLSVNVLAVALVTLKHQREKAAFFWTGVAEDNGLLKGDPRKALVDYLKDNGGENTPMIAGQAWNAFYRGTALVTVRRRKDDNTVRILGTPIGSKF